MADDKKKKFAVETKLNPFGEFKGKKPPQWSLTRINIFKDIKHIEVKRTLLLDARKWKMKTLVDGAYAVARTDLKLFATQLVSIEKALVKDLAKAGKKDLKFGRSTKGESKEINAALDDAAKSALDLFKKAETKIRDKVDLALDEVEADKGDNAKALAAGKEALRKFDRLDTNDMFYDPAILVFDALDGLADKLGSSPDAGPKEDYATALKDIKGAEKEFDAIGKTAANVVKYLLDAGAKMAKDKGANAVLQSLGKEISGSGKTKSSMEKLLKEVDSFDKEIDAAIKFVGTAKASGPATRQRAKKFQADNSGRDKAVDKALEEIKAIGKKFNEASKAVK